jgi:hypothetical protein
MEHFVCYKTDCPDRNIGGIRTPFVCVNTLCKEKTFYKPIYERNDLNGKRNERKFEKRSSRKSI